MKDKIILVINLYIDNKISKEALHACLVENGLSNNQLEIIAPSCIPITFSTFRGLAQTDLEFVENVVDKKVLLSEVLHFIINSDQRDAYTYMKVKHNYYFSSSGYWQVGSKSYNECEWTYKRLVDKYPTLNHWIEISPTLTRIVKEKKELVNILADLAFPLPTLITTVEQL